MADYANDKDIDGQEQKYYFKGRNTAILAHNEQEARSKKKRGGEELLAVQNLSDSEKKLAEKGTWIRTRIDGKSPAKSNYGQGRGYGPPRTKKAAAYDILQIALKLSGIK